MILSGRDSSLALEWPFEVASSSWGMPCWMVLPRAAVVLGSVPAALVLSSEEAWVRRLAAVVRVHRAEALLLLWWLLLLSWLG